MHPLALGLPVVSNSLVLKVMPYAASYLPGLWQLHGRGLCHAADGLDPMCILMCILMCN